MAYLNVFRKSCYFNHVGSNETPVPILREPVLRNCNCIYRELSILIHKSNYTREFNSRKSLQQLICSPNLFPQKVHNSCSVQTLQRNNNKGVNSICNLDNISCSEHCIPFLSNGVFSIHFFFIHLGTRE